MRLTKMSKGKKMCSFKTFKRVGLFGQWGNQTVLCSNPELTDEHAEKVKKDLKYCSARLCPYYKSK